MACDDFQGVDPNLFAIIAEILGLAAAGSMPFNVQNAIGNWLQLVGQVMLVYNAQQQYYEQGPGECFNRCSYNKDNPDCQEEDECNCQDEIKELKGSIEDLLKEIKGLKKEVEYLKKNR